MTVLRPVVVLAPPAGHSSSHGWPGSPALFKRQAEASPQQKSETCCQEKTCVADPTMGQRDPAREPDTEPGGVARPSEYRRAGACDEPHYSPGHIRIRTRPFLRTEHLRDPDRTWGETRAWGEVEERAIMNVSVLVMF